MLKNIIRSQTPEEQELEKKRSQLAALEILLAQRELDLATLQGEINAFELRYSRKVGILLAKVDEIDARIAEVLALFAPKDYRAKEQAQQARTQANETAKESEAAQAEPEKRTYFKPTESLKELYRNLAKRVHPDLATDNEDRQRRTRMMAEVNAAYYSGDEAKLQAIFHGWEYSPDNIQGETIGAELVRMIRKIAQVEERLAAIDAEIARINTSDSMQLKNKVEAAENEGRDLLSEMAAQLEVEITHKQKQLDELLDDYLSKRK